MYPLAQRERFRDVMIDEPKIRAACQVPHSLGNAGPQVIYADYAAGFREDVIIEVRYRIQQIAANKPAATRYQER